MLVGKASILRDIHCVLQGASTYRIYIFKYIPMYSSQAEKRVPVEAAVGSLNAEKGHLAI